MSSEEPIIDVVRPMRLIRTRLTWYAYLLSGFFTFILNIQGNIMPFLRDELRRIYAAVSLHPTALAAGMMATGLYTERVVAQAGRQRAGSFHRRGREKSHCYFGCYLADDPINHLRDCAMT